MEEVKQEFKPVDASVTFASAGKEYVAAPTKKLLKFNVAPFETTEQINQFKTTPDGKTNPDYGKPQPVLIFKAMLAEGEGKGQTYSTWITGYYQNGDKSKPVYSMGDRSKLGKIAEALCGSVSEFQKLTAGEIVGLPFLCALAEGKKDPSRLVLNIDKIMPPADDQAREELNLDVIPTADDMAEDGMMSALDAAMLANDEAAK